MLRKRVEIEESAVKEELENRLHRDLGEFAYIETEIYENDGTVEMRVSLEFPDEDCLELSQDFEIDPFFQDDEELLNIINSNMDELVSRIKTEVHDKLEQIVSTCRYKLDDAEGLLKLFNKRFGD